MPTRKPLDPHTLRWAARVTKREARKLRESGDDAAYVSGYGDAGHDLLVEARAIERKRRAK